MSPHRLHSFNPFLAVGARLLDVPGIGWLAGVLCAALGLIARDPFSGILLLCIASSMLDYYWGKRVARTLNRFDPARATAGWQSKTLGILLLLLVRGFEWWALRHSVPGVPGLLSVVIGVALFKADLDSLEHHRQALGAGPIPVISRVLALLDAIEERVLSVPARPRQAGGR